VGSYNVGTGLRFPVDGKLVIRVKGDEAVRFRFSETNSGEPATYRGNVFETPREKQNNDLMCHRNWETRFNGTAFEARGAPCQGDTVRFDADSAYRVDSTAPINVKQLQIGTAQLTCADDQLLANIGFADKCATTLYIDDISNCKADGLVTCLCHSTCPNRDMSVKQNQEARDLAEKQAAAALLVLEEPVNVAADITIALSALQLTDALIPQSATFDTATLADALAAAIGGGASTLVTVDSATADTTGAVRVVATVTAARAVFVTPGQDPAAVVDYTETATVGAGGPATTLQSAVLRVVAAAIGDTATHKSGAARTAADTVNAMDYDELDLFVDTVRPRKDLDIMTDATNKCVRRGLLSLAASLACGRDASCRCYRRPPGIAVVPLYLSHPARAAPIKNPQQRIIITLRLSLYSSEHFGLCAQLPAPFLLRA